MRKNVFYILAILLVIETGLFLSSCSAQNIPDSPKIGATMPNFELPDLDGNLHTLEQYKGKVVVLEMCSIKCPYSRGTDPSFTELANKYAKQGVVFLGIDSHHSTTVAEIKKYAAETKKTYPILKDKDNTYADAIGAKVTPEVYVVGKDGTLVYHGAFDNRTDPNVKGDDAYVDNAVQAALEGKAATPDRVKAWGCSIKRK